MRLEHGRMYSGGMENLGMLEGMHRQGSEASVCVCCHNLPAVNCLGYQVRSPDFTLESAMDTL